MRRVRLIVVASGVMTAGALGWSTGCVETDPDRLGSNPDDLDASAPVVTPVPACKGDPTDPANADLLTKDCAVFVRSGEGTSGDGTPEKPLTSLQKAITDATNGSTHKWVIACASGELQENISITASTTLYGGFDCTDPAKWVWSKDKKTKLTAPAGTIPLKITASPAGGDVTIKGFEITAASITDMKTPGASSIAVIVNQSKINLSYSNITAGDAANGLAGADASQTPPTKPVPTAMNNGLAACTVKGSGQASGGAATKNQCGDTDYSLGGFGGSSTQDTGLPGSPGKSDPVVPIPAGAAGGGDQSCASGTGIAGGDGAAGIVGPLGTGSGTLDANGWTGTSGGPGQTGKPGQGGGGGGGQKGGATVCAGGPGAGPTGGSGGTGGCGGQGGKGGGAGGSSIAMVSINAVLTLDNCNLKAGKAGAGGAGGKGQPGGAGGAPGAGGSGVAFGLSDACSGGAGGKGGNGGPGAGGPGGHSLAIAYTQVPPTSMQEVVFTPGAFGAGGKGGSTGNLNAPDGAPGADGTGMMHDGILGF